MLRVTYTNCSVFHCDFESYNCSYRKLDSDWCEVTCTLQIDAVVLQYPSPYKYVIYSSKIERQDDSYEYLHGYNWTWNRCLQIKYDQAIGGTGIYYENFYCAFIYQPLFVLCALHTS